MTDKEINQLAARVADLVLKKFVDYYDNHESLEVFKPTEEDVLDFEIQRLKQLLYQYEDQEEYEKAAIVKKKLEILNKRRKK
tara:strand:+ start:206 stop:451 length:246 start_codon:yes stop_codon:yes gene_type:complete